MAESEVSAFHVRWRRGITDEQLRRVVHVVSELVPSMTADDAVWFEGCVNHYQGQGFTRTQAVVVAYTYHVTASGLEC